MAFEKKVPEWNAAGAEPPASLKNSGFQAGYKPAADYFNWFWNGMSEAAAELQEKAFTLCNSYSGDMNTLLTAGQYRLEANANLPADAYYGQAFVGRAVPSGGGSDTVAQLVISPNTKTMIYRGGQFINSAWKWEAWSEVYSTSNKPTAADVGAIPTIKSIPESADLNTYTTPGFYYCISDVAVSGFTNCPTKYAFYMEVGKHAGTYQRIVEYGTAVAKVYFRNLYAGYWGEWQREYTTVDKPSASDVGAVDATAELLSTTTITEAALAQANGTVKHYAFSGESYTGNDLPSSAYKYGSATVFKRYGFTVIVLWGAPNAPRIATKYYSTTTGTWTDWVKSYTTNDRPTSADVGAAEASSHNIRTYTNLSQLGLSNGATMSQVARALPGSSMLRMYVLTSENANLAPTSTNGWIEVNRPSANHAEFRFTSTSKRVYYANVLNVGNDEKETVGEWTEVYSEFNKPTPADIGASATGHKHTKSEITDLKTETWTFTLEDGSTVTKAVYVG